MTHSAASAFPATADEDAVLCRPDSLPDSIGWTVQADTGDAWERVCEEANRAARAIVHMGLHLLWLRARLPSTEFAAGLDARGILSAQAGGAMRIANLLVHVEEPAVCERLLDMSPAHMKGLAILDPDELDEGIESGEIDIDEFSTMSAAQARRWKDRCGVATERAVQECLEVHRIRAETEVPSPVTNANDRLVPQLQQFVGIEASRLFGFPHPSASSD